MNSPRAIGHEDATLAFDLFVARLRDGIVTMAAELQGFDALLFTGGIGAHAAEVRAAVCEQLAWLGVRCDPAANEAAQPDCLISPAKSRIAVLAIQTDEEQMVARDTRCVLGL